MRIICLGTQYDNSIVTLWIPNIPIILTCLRGNVLEQTFCGVWHEQIAIKSSYQTKFNLINNSISQWGFSYCIFLNYYVQDKKAIH